MPSELHSSDPAASVGVAMGGVRAASAGDEQSPEFPQESGDSKKSDEHRNRSHRLYDLSCDDFLAAEVRDLSSMMFGFV